MLIARTLPADTDEYVERMRQYAEKEENESCREMIEDNIQEIGLAWPATPSGTAFSWYSSTKRA